MKIAAYGKLVSSFEYGYTKGESGLATDQAWHMAWRLHSRLAAGTALLPNL